MASAKGKIVRLISALALERATVVGVEAFGGFRRVLMKSSVQRFAAGTKVQLLLPSDDMRTYTPVWTAEGMVFLGWSVAGGPGSRWMTEARVGDELPFVGPQRSLQLPAVPVVIVGDETSVGVAAAFATERPGVVHAVFQSDAADDVRAAAASVALHPVDVVGRGDTAATVHALLAKLATSPEATVALTGGSELIVAVRDALRRAGVGNIKTKAYWIPGKSGLD